MRSDVPGPCPRGPGTYAHAEVRGADSGSLVSVHPGVLPTCLSGAPRSPTSATPLLPAGWVRRTTHLEMLWDGASLMLSGAARDVRASQDRMEVLRRASVKAYVDSGKRLRELELDPKSAGSMELCGSEIASGFRARAHECCPELAGTPAGLLLDDLPGVVLIAPYMHLRDMALRGEPPGKNIPPEAVSMLADVCAGWRAGGTAMDSVARGDGIPLQDCPPAEPLEAPDDAGAWHAIAPLESGRMRRRRRLDVGITPGPSPTSVEPSAVVVDAMFRDSHGEPDGTEVVLHEYSLTVEVSRSDSSILEVQPVARVLPFPECPLAIAYVAELKGKSVGELRELVPAMLRGTKGCTHLNDLLRVLADVPRLASSLLLGDAPLTWAVA